MKEERRKSEEYYFDEIDNPAYLEKPPIEEIVALEVKQSPLDGATDIQLTAVEYHDHKLYYM